MRQTVKQGQLHFRFTEKDFLIDEPQGEVSERLQPWKEKFEENKWKVVYEIGFEAKPDWLDAAGSFLYLLADLFQKQLTRQPDLELSREKTEVCGRSISNIKGCSENRRDRNCMPDTELGFNVQTCCGSFVWNWCQI